METELKFALAPRIAGRVLRHPAIERIAAAPAASNKLLSVYYDTPDFKLRAAGIALRLRRSDAGWVQTAKWGGSVLGGLHSRNELEVAVAEQKLELDALTEPALAAMLAPVRLRKRLKPVFVTDFQRVSRMLAWPAGGEIELSLDRGRIVAGHAQAPICELELELKSGEPEILFELVDALGPGLALRPEARSKAERGYVLAGLKPSPVRARPVVLEQSLSIADSAALIVAAGLEHLQANEHGMAQDRDPEYLHQARVAVRRLRSCLSIYGHALPPDFIAGLRAELRWFGQRLGPARDWDVFLTEMLPPLEAGLRGAEDLDALCERAQQLRDAASRSARAALGSRRYARLLLALAKMAATRAWRMGEGAERDPVLPFATRVLERRFERVLERGSGKKGKSVEELHALRIAVKKLRYAVEFFAGLYAGVGPKAFREHLVELQDSLGTINDASTMLILVERALPPQSRLRAVAAGWSARMMQDERTRLRAHWRAFRRRRKFW